MARACTTRPSRVPAPRSRTPSGVMVSAVTPEWPKLPKAQTKPPKAAVITMLFRTGVHIIAPKRPRALRTCPSRTCAPMKNMVGRQ